MNKYTVLAFLCLIVLSLCIHAVTSMNVNKTILEWKRQMRTCDDNSDINIPLTGTSRVIYAIGSSVPNSDTSVSRHISRGTKNINFMDAAPIANKLPLDAKIMPIMTTRVPIPTKETYYHCQGMVTENLPNKTHILRITPQIDYDNAAFVHHILMFVCSEGLSTIDLAFRGGCYEGLMPSGLSNCDQKNVVAGWAVGGGELVLPQEAGFPMGPGPTYYMLQVHYHNPSLINFNDSAGFNLTYTETLRPNDAAVLEVSRAISTIDIPANEIAYNVDAFCPSQCTAGLPSEGINVYGSLLHTHLAGRSVRVKQIRDGVELPDLDYNENYDFNYQQVVQFVPGQKKILRGDDLKLTCTYNTVGRTGPVRGGISTTAEMCIAYLFYYPANPVISSVFTQCESVPSTRNVTVQCNGPSGYRILNVLQPNITKPLPPQSCYVSPLANYTYTSGYDKTTYVSPQQFNASKYNRNVILDDAGVYKLYWNVSLDENQNGVMSFAAEVETVGWIGLGISPSGNMFVSDVALGWVKSSGGAPTVDMTDRYTTAYSMPTIDKRQDIFNVVGTQGLFPKTYPIPDSIYYNVNMSNYQNNGHDHSDSSTGEGTSSSSSSGSDESSSSSFDITSTISSSLGSSSGLGSSSSLSSSSILESSSSPSDSSGLSGSSSISSTSSPATSISSSSSYNSSSSSSATFGETSPESNISIVGISVGAPVALLFLAFICFLYLKKSKSQRNTNPISESLIDMQQYNQF